MAALVLLLLAGCGMAAQDRPEAISVAEPPSSDPDLAPGGGGKDVTVFFVRGGRLEPVSRSAEPKVGTVLDLLVAGPTRMEVIGGLRTALAPQPLLPEPSGTVGSVITIAVTREFTEIAGRNQLLAVAQVVWTVTQFPGIDVVRVTTEGGPVEVPTDEGLTDQPVGRSDYLSVAPRGDEPPAASTSTSAGTPASTSKLAERPAPGGSPTPTEPPPAGSDGTVPPAMPSSPAPG